MSIYSYTAYTPEGELKKGSQISSNKADLHMILEAQGLTVVSIEEEKLTQKTDLFFVWKNKAGGSRNDDQAIIRNDSGRH